MEPNNCSHPIPPWAYVGQEWFDSFICAIWRIHIGWRRIIGCLIFMGRFPRKSPKISGSFARNHLQLDLFRCAMTHSYLFHYLFICVTWLSHTCSITYSYVWPERKTLLVTWVISHIWMRHVTHALNHPREKHCSEYETCKTHEWVMSHMNESCHAFGWAMSDTWMRDVTRINESCHGHNRRAYE